MRIELVDGDIGWPLVEALDREVYSPEILARVVWRDVVWVLPDKRVVVSENGRAVCHAGVFFREGLLNGTCVRMGGVGGVMTAPAARRRGLAAAAMKCAAEAMQDAGVDFGLLFCESHNVKLYSDLGWRIFEGTVRCEQPSGPMIFDMMPAMVLPLRLTPERGSIDLCGLPW